MVEPADPLAALFARDAAPAVDPLFTLTVLAEVQRRAALNRLVWTLAYAVLGVVLLLAGWPAIRALSGGFVSAFASAAPFVLAGALAGAFLLGLGRWRLRDLPPQLAALAGISHL